MGFEPTTFRSTGGCSNQAELRRQEGRGWVDGRNRTDDAPFGAQGHNLVRQTNSRVEHHVPRRGRGRKMGGGTQDYPHEPKQLRFGSTMQHLSMHRQLHVTASWNGTTRTCRITATAQPLFSALPGDDRRRHRSVVRPPGGSDVSHEVGAVGFEPVARFAHLPSSASPNVDIRKLCVVLPLGVEPRCLAATASEAAAYASSAREASSGDTGWARTRRSLRSLSEFGCAEHRRPPHG